MITLILMLVLWVKILTIPHIFAPSFFLKSSGMQASRWQSSDSVCSRFVVEVNFDCFESTFDGGAVLATDVLPGMERVLFTIAASMNIGL